MRLPRSGVTLVELLVVAFVISVLLLISIPVIRNFKVRQHDMENIDRIRSTTQDFYTWSTDHSDYWPNAGSPRSPIIPTAYPPAAPPVGSIGIYLSQVSGWPRIMTLSGYAPSAHWHTTEGPNDMGGQIDLSQISDPNILHQMHSRMMYTNAVRFSSEIWTADRDSSLSHDDLLPHAKHVRVSDIRFPAAKGVLVNLSRRYGDDVMHVGFGDGSAESRRSEAALPAASVPWSNPLRVGNPIVSTVDGFAGRDF